MIGWMCGVILSDELSCAELRQRQGTEDKSKSGTNKKIAIVWTCFIEGMMINWGERCVTLEVEGTKQRDRPRNTWKEVVDKAMNHFALKLRTERCYGSS